MQPLLLQPLANLHLWLNNSQEQDNKIPDEDRDEEDNEQDEEEKEEKELKKKKKWNFMETPENVMNCLPLMGHHSFLKFSL